MKYLLDTNIISYFFKGVPGVIENFKKISPHELAISAITSMEIEFGLNLNPERAKKLTPKWKEFNKLITVLPLENEEAVIAGQLRAKLQKEGLNIGILDLLIGATALRHKLICVTNNIKEFERILHLPIEDWTN